MEKFKNIITGILSVAVFFMAVQVGVAQEKATASNNKVEVKKANMESKAHQIKSLAVSVDKNSFEAPRRLTQQEWYQVSLSGDSTDHTLWTIVGFSPDPEPGVDPNDCTLDNPGNFCAMLLEFDAQEDPNQFINQTRAEAESDGATVQGFAKQP